MDEVPPEIQRRVTIRAAIYVLAVIGLVAPISLLLIFPTGTASAIGETVGGLAGAAALILLAWQVFLQRSDIEATHEEMREQRKQTEALVRLGRVFMQAQLKTGLAMGWVAEGSGSGDLVPKPDPSMLMDGNALLFRLVMRRTGLGEAILHELILQNPMGDPLPPVSVPFPIQHDQSRPLIGWLEKTHPSLRFAMPIFGANIVHDSDRHWLLQVRVDGKTIASDWERFKRLRFSVEWYANVKVGAVELASGLSMPDLRQDLTI